MADFADRTTHVDKINQAFSAANIQATAQRLSPLRPSADFLDICHRLGTMDHIVRRDLRTYRRELTMPQLSRRIMTVAFRTSLLNQPKPIPLHLNIIDGEAEAVEVTHTPAQISVKLTRTRPALKRRS